MRIFQVIEHSTNLDLKTNSVWYQNLYEPLIDLGHEVVLVSATPGREALQHKSSKMRERFSKDVLTKFEYENKIKPFQLAFFYIMDGMLDSFVVAEIKSRGVIAVNFSCNNIHQFNLVDRISHWFDLNLFSEKKAKSKFDKVGAKSMWWPMASNPNYFYPKDIARSIEATFVGQRYANRLDLAFRILQKGIDLHVYGPNWEPSHTPRTGGGYTALRWGKFLSSTWVFSDLAKKTNASYDWWQYNFWRFSAKAYPENFHGPVNDQRLVDLYSESHITLGFLEVYSGHRVTGEVQKHLHLRDFEACMAGALYLTDDDVEMAEMFEPKFEVLLASSVDEKVDLIKYYLNHPNEANIIRRNARKRAIAEHTYHLRFKALFRALGI